MGLRRRDLATGAAAAFLLLALFAACRETAPGPAAVAASRPPSRASLGRAPPAPALQDQAALPPPDQRTPAAQARPAATPGDRILAALQSEDLQVRAEAHRLLRHCAFVLAPGAARPLVAPPAWMAWDTVRRADQAWQAATQRCDSLRNLPDRDALQRRLDPVPGRDGEGGPSVEAEGRWLTQTFREHGGTALLWAGDALVAYLEQRTGEADADGFDLLDAEAVQIARCRLGEDCGADSDAAQAACLTLGACEGDVPQRLLLALGSRAARERVQRQAGALADALARGDLARYALGQ